LRFAVRRPGSPVASPRSHGVPRRDVPGRVHIRVAGVIAGGAPEACLALARLPVHLPAGAGQVRGGLFHPVLAGVCLAGFEPGDGPPHSCTAIGSPRGAGEPALEAAHPALPPRAQPRHGQHLARGQRRTDRHATVKSRHLASPGARNRLRDGGEGDVPASGTIQRDPVGPRGGNGAGPAEGRRRLPGLRSAWPRSRPALLPPLAAGPPSRLSGSRAGSQA